MTQFYWHVHHDILLEPLTDSVENRIAYILASKPVKEHKVRLRLLKPVVGPLPVLFVKAGVKFVTARDKYDAAGVKYVTAPSAKCVTARDKYDAAWVEYVKAKVKFVTARDKYEPELLALHAIECPSCPWDGQTIFPNEETT